MQSGRSTDQLRGPESIPLYNPSAVMALLPGMRLGVYEVRERIGAGGMGEVYRAHDAKLNRDVALKTLPDTFALDPDRLARFQREAQVLASLNHANVAAIFGFEDAGGVQTLVLELVEGPTLAERIARGPLPLDEALGAARQIADALEAAHAQGIVHRDLKPANIKIRSDGTVKVLDFGLAKLIGPADAGALSPGESAGLSAANSPTLTRFVGTGVGVILGTAAYMSPEQARGKTVDKRSDIWAFGAVLYEMLVGKPAFDGEEVSDTLANILKSEPDWARLPSATPTALRRMLRRCLEKDPRRRLRDIADARLDLDEQDAIVAAAPAPPPARWFTYERLAWAVVAATLAGVLAYTLRREPVSSQPVRFQVQAPDRGFLGSDSGVGRFDATSGAALSSDGTQLAYVATDQSGRSSLWLRRLDSFTSRALPGTEDGLMPFWSPDGRSIGFFADGKVKTVTVADGATETVATVATPPRGGSWSKDGVILFSSGSPPRLARVSARGGATTAIVFDGQSFPEWPWFLPDGRHFLFVGRAGDDAQIQPGIHVGSIEPGFEPKLIVTSDGNGVYTAPGYLLFSQGNALQQQPFDLRRMQLTGEATPLGVQLQDSRGVRRADFTVSQNGVLAYRSVASQANQFAWFDRAGKLLETVGPPGLYRTPDLSPDGTQLAYFDINQSDLWILDMARQTTSRFTSGSGSEQAPVWFPDGRKIAYRKDGGGLFEKDVGGTAAEKALFTGAVNGPMQVSRDGNWIVYFAVTPKGTQDIFVLPTSAGGTPKPVVESPFADVEPQLSPDGRWLAYASTETGRNEIYVQPFPPTGRRWQVSSRGGRQPLWRADGKELFFVADDRKFYVADIAENSTSFEFGVPRFLFDMRANVFNARNSYIPSRDGQRFLVNMLLETDSEPINVVQNWPASVR